MKNLLVTLKILYLICRVSFQDLVMNSGYYDHNRKENKKLKKLIRDIWLVSYSLLLFFMSAPFFSALVVVVTLLLTFVSFAILDENQDNETDE